jgi:threonine/homoserine/homoserine lactone efflux protein
LKNIQKYLPKNKPLVVGFLISLIGTLPLGYLNVIGLQLLLENGYLASIQFILGIVFIEFFVLKVVSYGSKWLVQQQKLLLFIDIFTVLFFSSLAYYFFATIGNEQKFSLKQLQLIQVPFILGVLLNSLNFMQWPYWSSIYLYLFRTKKLKSNSNKNNIFIMGALLGTFSGMMLFAQTGNYFLIDKKADIGKYLNVIFTFIFLGLALVQFINLFWKRRKVNLI